MTSERRYQVVIVGGGPVGVALAVELGLRGVSCALVERHLRPQRIPKGQNLTQRTLEHFYFWGIADELRAARLLPPGYPIGGVTAYGNLMSDYWFAQAGREVVRQYYFQDNERLPQYLTEDVLRARAAELPNVTSLFGWTATAVEQDDRAARVRIASADGDEQVLEGEYLVGCDGARSMVREQLGIDRGGADFDQRMVLAVFRSRELHEGLKRFPERTTYRVLHPELPGYWQFFGRVDVGEGWFFHAPVPTDTTPDNYDFLGLIQDAAGFPFAASFDHVGFWDLRIAVASRYRDDRVFIAGDACHSHPPYGGFGLNSGLEDVANLGWKLTAVLEGWGSDALLDSYGEERRPIFVETGEAMIAGGIEADRAFLERYNPERDREEFDRAWKALEGNAAHATTVVRAALRGLVGGVRSAERRVQHPRHVCLRGPGWAPPDATGAVERAQRFRGARLRGFTLLAFDADSRPFEATSIPLKVVRDTYAEGRSRYASKLVLVRPDQYVVWTGDQPPENVDALLQRVTGGLRAH